MLFSRSVLLAEASNYRFTLPTSLNFIVTVLSVSPTGPSPTKRPHLSSGDAAAFPEATNTTPPPACTLGDASLEKSTTGRHADVHTTCTSHRGCLHYLHEPH